MLSDAQQQLLHAWVDGESGDADSRVVMDLLHRPEASEYVSELKRLRELVAKHAGIHAPPGLFERVRDALRREARAPVLHVYAWRLAALAAAATVLIAVGIALGPSLLNTDLPQRPQISGPVTPAPETAVNVPPPVPPADKVSAGRPSDDAGVRHALEKAAEPAPAVLRLDRGVDQPFELSLHLDRGLTAHTSQVYNDMLVVSNLYGEAELKDGEAATEFTGRDFAEFEGVAVEIEESRVPELIAALDRLAADQQYGQVVVPRDLDRQIDSSRTQVNELLRAADPNLPLDSARSYLPPELLHERMSKELKGEELQRLGSKEPQPPRDDAATRPATPKRDHKVKLLLRLR